MSEYKERTVTATAHQRTRAVTFTNARGKTPHVVFQEEEVLIDGEGNVVSRDTTYCEADLDRSNGVIALRNPNTGALTGQSITHAQLYAAIYSLYRQVAELRDSAP